MKGMARRMALLCAVLLLCGGCRAADTLRTVVQSLRFSSFQSEKYIERFRDNWCYRQLDEAMQADYGDLYTALTDGWDRDRTVEVSGETPVSGWGEEIRLSHPLSSEQAVRQLFLAFTNDNPQFFHLERHYGMYGFQRDGEMQYEYLTVLYTMDSKKRQAAIKEVESRTAAVLRQAAAVTDPFERELLLHDFLAEQCTYDKRPEEQLTHAYTMYGALVEGSAVCEGYARAMQWLLHRSGMESTLLLGQDPDGQPHMWNLVTVDGEPYHLDVTWNDTDDLPRHNYFNLTTAETQVTHMIADDNIGLPECTATAANYYRRTGRFIDTYNRRDIVAAVAQAVQAGEETVELRFGEGKWDNAVLFLQSSYFFELVNAQLNGQTMWSFDLYTSADEGILMLAKAAS